MLISVGGKVAISQTENIIVQMSMHDIAHSTKQTQLRQCQDSIGNFWGQWEIKFSIMKTFEIEGKNIKQMQTLPPFRPQDEQQEQNTGPLYSLQHTH